MEVSREVSRALSPVEGVLSRVLLGLLFFVLSGCSAKYLKYEKAEELKKIDEFDQKVKIVMPDEDNDNDKGNGGNGKGGEKEKSNDKENVQANEHVNDHVKENLGSLAVATPAVPGPPDVAGSNGAPAGAEIPRGRTKEKTEDAKKKKRRKGKVVESVGGEAA
ncbi:MAG: hypothetical protein C5B49_14165, partial [Bdellovibrio sp.]